MNVLIKTGCGIFIALIFLLSCGSKELIDDTEEIVTGPSGAAPNLALPEVRDASTDFVVLKGTVVGKGGSVVTNRGFCWSLEALPTIDDANVEASSVNGAGEFSAEIKGLTQNTTYHIRAWAKNKGGIGYSESFQFTTNKVQPAVFTETPLFIVGSMRAAYDVEIANSGGGEITERGVCWSTDATPTVDDSKYVDAGVGTGKFRAVIAGLTERTQYYLRAYAINEGGVSYGTSMPFKTIGKGKLTYTLNDKPENPTGEIKAVWDRLQIAVDSAAWYIENYTSAQKHVWVNYAPQTPTADANNEGWMRFGTGVDYQNLRTMLHELNHCFGTGTTSWWTGTALSNGKYQLPHANNMLKLINNDNDAVLSGDGWHWWPYGLNQNNEVTSSWDYVYNCLIIEAMRRDGLTHSGLYTP